MASYFDDLSVATSQYVTLMIKGEKTKEEIFEIISKLYGEKIAIEVADAVEWNPG